MEYFFMPSHLTSVSAFSSLSPTEAFLPSRCSYSSRASRCWCTLEHNEEELRTIHMIYLCVTSIAGNATSKLLDFTPLGIRKWVCPHVCFSGQDSGAEIGYRIPGYCYMLIAASVTKETEAVAGVQWQVATKSPHMN